MFKKTLLLTLIFNSVPAVASDSLVDVWQNNQAVELLHQEKKTEAYEEFARILSDDPFHPLYQFNMGSSFISVEEKEKAIKMYKEILKNKFLDPNLAFGVLYNLGVLHGSNKEIEKALHFYQEALVINPESKEVKTNIELLIAKGKGKGKGKGKNKKDGKKKDPKEDEQKEPQKFQNQPKSFKSKDMSKSDVKKILEELKKQEQRIRAKHERKGKKEAARGKSW